MTIRRLERDWDELARTDPLRAILGRPGEGKPLSVEEFFAHGADEVREVMRYAKSLDLPRRRRTALDFGCGTGRLTQALAGYFETVTGVDVSGAMVALARRYNKHPDRCRFLHNPSPRLDQFPDNSQDLIYSAITLQHMPPSMARGYLRELVRVLASDGLLLFQLPSHRTRPWLATIMPGNSYAALGSLALRIFGRGRSLIDMSGIRRGKVVRLIEDSGGRVLAHQYYEGAEGAWAAFRYAVTKPL